MIKRKLYMKKDEFAVVVLICHKNCSRTFPFSSLFSYDLCKLIGNKGVMYCHRRRKMMVNTKYKYSVLMSVYIKEHASYLDSAIKSMLDQTIKPDEFIIVKDGPLTKELDKVIEKYISKNPNLFKVIVNDVNLGLGPSLRKGVEISKNELIARMDSDDFSIPERCEKQLKVLESDNQIGLVGSFESEFINDISNVVSIHRVPEKNNEIKQFMKRRCAILHPTVIFKKSEVIKAGNYQKTSIYPIYEDYDLFARMVFDANVRCYNVQESLYYIRTSEDFYERRGGFKYARTAIRFKWHLFLKHNMSFIDFCISGLGQGLVSLLPNKLRKLFYKTFLRK